MERNCMIPKWPIPCPAESSLDSSGAAPPLGNFSKKKLSEGDNRNGSEQRIRSDESEDSEIRKEKQKRTFTNQ